MMTLFIVRNQLLFYVYRWCATLMTLGSARSRARSGLAAAMSWVLLIPLQHRQLWACPQKQAAFAAEQQALLEVWPDDVELLAVNDTTDSPGGC
jgi:hypothetical protein